MNLREAAQQALEALEMSTRFVYADNRPQCENAINALRAALAEDRSADIGETSDHFCDARKMIEPVAMVTSESGNEEVTMSWWHDPALPVGTKLYTAPPKREPLTDDEIHDCFQQKHKDKGIERRMIARAIERAHGIGSEE